MSLAICLYRRSIRTVVSGVVVVIVVVGICNCSHMRTTKCTSQIFVASIDFTIARNAQKEFLIEVIVEKKIFFFESNVPFVNNVVPAYRAALYMRNACRAV